MCRLRSLRVCGCVRARSAAIALRDAPWAVPGSRPGSTIGPLAPILRGEPSPQIFSRTPHFRQRLSGNLPVKSEPAENTGSGHLAVNFRGNGAQRKLPGPFMGSGQAQENGDHANRESNDCHWERLLPFWMTSTMRPFCAARTPAAMDYMFHPEGTDVLPERKLSG